MTTTQTIHDKKNVLTSADVRTIYYVESYSTKGTCLCLDEVRCRSQQTRVQCVNRLTIDGM